MSIEIIRPRSGTQSVLTVWRLEYMEDGWESTLEQTLGEERVGMIVVDYDGNPICYDHLAVMDDIVARHTSARFDFEAVATRLGMRMTIDGSGDAQICVRKALS